jgi:Domain of unknown function (DUF6265)
MKIIPLLIFFTISIFAQDESIIKLFPGKWKMNSDKMEYYEDWELVNETELVGIGFSIEEGDSILSEQLYLKKFAEQWAYVAIPDNQAITLFALQEFSQNKFSFENKEHDFPQRIIYEFKGDDQLEVAIEGVIDGELMKRDFSFRHIDK